ncbi:hypothetical protein N9Z02_00655 [Akkermansiaceae bacterium]|nr:hypothetical protein [Akkermansiaceae bacterium]
MRLRFLGILIFWLLWLPVLSQEKGATATHLRILAVGDESRRPLGVGDDNFLPDFVTMPVGDGQIKTIPLALNKLTPQVKIDDDFSPVFLFAGQQVAERPWQELDVVGGTTSLVVLSRRLDVEKRTWSKVTAQWVEDSVLHFPEKAVRVVNASDDTVLIRIADEKAFVMEPRTSKIRKLEEGCSNFLIGQRGVAKKIRRIFENSLEMGKGMRMTIVIHQSDAKEAHGVSRVRVFSEQVPLVFKK